jgi:hypothetical protein
MSQINAEFGRGNNLNAYRGTAWYTDAGGSGTFSSGAISFNEFYSKRATPVGSVAISNQSVLNFLYSGLGGGNATGYYQLLSTGVARKTNGLTGNGVLTDISGEWLVSGSASLFDVYATFSNPYGTVGTELGSTGSWLNLGTTRDWGLTVTDAYAHRLLDIQIRLASTGSVLDSATITFEIDSAP